ncbi:MAG TPA: hypothetical protein VGY54_15405 [Polyangiaceae bacterium]|nr:hypothetical protein [Polyangiaceae bacterium]
MSSLTSGLPGRGQRLFLRSEALPGSGQPLFHLSKALTGRGQPLGGLLIKR